MQQRVVAPDPQIRVPPLGCYQEDAPCFAALTEPMLTEPMLTEPMLTESMEALEPLPR